MGEPGARLAQARRLSPREVRLLQAARDLVPAMRARAAILDRDGEFPSLDFSALRRIGALTAVIPKRLDGLGLGIDRGRARVLFDLLRIVGRGNLAVGRIFEGHVNAFKLISLFGNEQQIQRAAKDLEAGHLFAIWNAEADNGVRLRDASSTVLTGAKVFCSAAGHVTRAS
jgi:alkylation response protein AidB-like acyl-CoA dehydrogenase